VVNGYGTEQKVPSHEQKTSGYNLAWKIAFNHCSCAHLSAPGIGPFSLLLCQVRVGCTHCPSVFFLFFLTPEIHCNLQNMAAILCLLGLINIFRVQGYKHTNLSELWGICILILGNHIVTLLTMRIRPMHMAPFSVNITRFGYV